MNKNQIWKLIFILLIIGVCFGLISPFSDRELGEYALGQVTSEANESNHVGYETFAEVIETIRNQIPDDEAIDFLKLKNFGTTNRIDYAAFFQSPQGVLGTVCSRLFPFIIKPGIRASHIKDREKRNEVVLRSLLRGSQAAIKRGLDLRGGIAFTMEVTDLNDSTVESMSGASPLDKVVEIMSDRLNAFGVAETLVRKKGDNAIEIQIPDRTTKQDPGKVEDLQKPAKLEFRIVNVDSNASTSSNRGGMDRRRRYPLRCHVGAVTLNPMKDPFGLDDYGQQTEKSLKKLILAKIRWVDGKWV